MSVAIRKTPDALGVHEYHPRVHTPDYLGNSEWLLIGYPDAKTVRDLVKSVGVTNIKVDGSTVREKTDQEKADMASATIAANIPKLANTLQQLGETHVQSVVTLQTQILLQTLLLSGTLTDSQLAGVVAIQAWIETFKGRYSALLPSILDGSKTDVTGDEYAAELAAPLPPTLASLGLV